MKSNIYKISLLLLCIFGCLLPFIPTLVVVEMFFLLIPLLFIFIVTLVFLLTSLFRKKDLKRNTLIFLLPLVFIFSQFVSTFTVHNFLKFKSERLIDDLTNYKNEFQKYPENLNDSMKLFAIEYKLMKNSEYQLKFNRGFMVREVYNSKDKKWSSYGWND